MAKRSLADDQMSVVRASIGSIFTKKTAFDKWGKKRFTKLCNNITTTIDIFLEALGTAVVEKAVMIIESSNPSGHTYLIVNEDGDVLDKWQASSDGQPPAVVTGLLQNSIEYRIGSGKDRADFVEVGVWSEEPWEYETIAFRPARKRDEDEEIDEDDPENFPRIIVDESGEGYPVKNYAKNMEEGFENKEYGPVAPRPFLKPAFEQAVMEKRKDLQKLIKQAFMNAFGEKVPISFRIYVSKAYQNKG